MTEEEVERTRQARLQRFQGKIDCTKFMPSAFNMIGLKV